MYSVELERFLRAIKQCELDYDYHYRTVGEKDKETQDLLHEIELGATYERRVKAVPKLTKVRKERRISKDIVENTEPIVKFMDANKKLFNMMQNLLGDVRRIEKKHSGRTYIPKIRKDLTI